MHILVTNTFWLYCLAMFKPVAICRAPAARGMRVRYLVMQTRGRKLTAAERVANCNGTTMNINLVEWNTELLYWVDSLWCESLVDLEEVDIVERQSGLLENLGDRECRADTHDARGNTDDRSSNVFADDGEAKALSHGASGEKDSSSTVRDLRGVAWKREVLVMCRKKRNKPFSVTHQHE